MAELRDYQQGMIGEARTLMHAGVRTLLIESPTGSGKTILTAAMLKSAQEKHVSSWFICHRRELISQSTYAFDSMNVKHGVIAAGFSENPHPLTQICSIQTLAKRHRRVRPPRLIVWDECHHIGAKSWGEVFEAYPDAFHIGLTATPVRLDGTGLIKYFSRIIHGPRVPELISRGFLSPYRIYAPSRPDLSQAHTRMGDFIRSELSNIVDKPTITGDAIDHYKRLTPGKRAVVFCVSVQHSKHVAESFARAGIPASHVDGETPIEARDLAIRNFERGTIQVLCNVELFGEGFDLPAMEVAILLRPTQSLGLYLQQVGRVLRSAPGKTEALILDHAGNCERHGFPDDEREWSLEGSNGLSKRLDGSRLAIQICPSCFAAQRPGERCRYCGVATPAQAREVEEVEGELVEVDPALVRKLALHKKKEQGKARSLEELVEIGKQRGYKSPAFWAAQVFKSRQGKRGGE